MHLLHASVMWFIFRCQMPFPWLFFHSIGKILNAKSLIFMRLSLSLTLFLFYNFFMYLASSFFFPFPACYSLISAKKKKMFPYCYGSYIDFLKNVDDTISMIDRKIYNVRTQIFRLSIIDSLDWIIFSESFSSSERAMSQTGSFSK